MNLMFIIVNFLNIVIFHPRGPILIDPILLKRHSSLYCQNFQDIVAKGNVHFVFLSMHQNNTDHSTLAILTHISNIN